MIKCSAYTTWYESCLVWWQINRLHNRAYGENTSSEIHFVCMEHYERTSNKQANKHLVSIHSYFIHINNQQLKKRVAAFVAFKNAENKHMLRKNWPNHKMALHPGNLAVSSTTCKFQQQKDMSNQLRYGTSRWPNLRRSWSNPSDLPRNPGWNRGVNFTQDASLLKKTKQGHNRCWLNQPFQAYAGQIASFPK